MAGQYREHLAQVAQLRQSPVSTLVKTRTERRKLGEHERAKANFEASLGTPTTAAEFEDRSVIVWCSAQSLLGRIAACFSCCHQVSPLLQCGATSVSLCKTGQQHWGLSLHACCVQVEEAACLGVQHMGHS